MKTHQFRINTLTLALALFAILIHQPSTALAQGTAFTYQGRLNDGAGAASGSYDLRFAVYAASSGGAPVGSTLTNTATDVSNGLFTVALEFGNVFPGAARWLEIAVRTNGSGAFATLTPRQPITPNPYAIYAAGADASGIVGALPATALLGTYGNALSFTNAGNSYAGNGAGLTQLNASQLKSGMVDDIRLPASIARTNQVWLLAGNAGTTAGANFLGTTDGQPLEIKVNNMRALRLEDNGDGSDPNLLPDGAPNLIAGSSANAVSPGVVGATVAGGGATNQNGAARNVSGLGNEIVGGAPIRVPAAVSKPCLINFAQIR